MTNPFEKFAKPAATPAQPASSPAPSAPGTAAPAASAPAPGNPFANFQKAAPPQPAAAEPAPAVASASVAPSGGINLSKLEEKAPGLIKLSKSAGISLEKKGLTGVRAAVYLVLDYSGSMSGYYRNGTVQDFNDKILAASVHFDDDGSIPVVLFDNHARRPEEVSLDNYQGALNDIVSRAGRMSTTNYAAAIEMVKQHYLASGASVPALVIFQTDGSPDSRRDAERAICEAAHLPIFWQFVGFGNDRFEFLHKLDDLSVPQKRPIDNTGFFSAGRDPKNLPAGDLYDSLMGEFPSWLAEAKRQGIVS